MTSVMTTLKKLRKRYKFLSMNLESYLDLYEVLEYDHSPRNERRTFALSHPELKGSPAEQLSVWANTQKVKLKRPLLSETFSSYLYWITLTLSFLAFVLGLLSGIGLLSYNGHEPVNVIYFIAMVVFVPLVTMSLAVLSMFRANRSHSMLIHLSPAFWMERIVALLPNKVEKQLKGRFSELKINPLILNWLVIKRSQVLALAFSFGLLLALLAMVATRDIAFAWSTTLSVTPEAFHHLLNTLSFAWRDLFPWAVPSVELVEQSQYYRLGEKLGDTMIAHAALLGEWWKFLLFATLFYAVLLRFVMYIISTIGLKRAIGRSFMTLEGSKKLLSDMNEVNISTHARTSENDFSSKTIEYTQVIDTFDRSYDIVLGWAIDQEKLMLINEHMQVIAPNFFEAGGANSLEEDSEVISKCHGEILFYVKAWEPPTMDFIDFLESLLEKADKVIVAPIGTELQGYVSKEKDVNVWARKLFTLNSEKVWLKISSAQALNGEAENARS